MFKQYECQHMSPFRDRVKLQRININYHFLLQFKLKPDTMKNLFYLPALAGLLMLAPRAQAQIINTVAGNGTPHSIPVAICISPMRRTTACAK